MIMESLLKQLLDPKDKRLTRNYPQDIRQVSFPEGSQAFLFLNPYRTVQKAFISFLEETLLHKLWHHLNTKSNEV